MTRWSSEQLKQFQDKSSAALTESGSGSLDKLLPKQKEKNTKSFYEYLGPEDHVQIDIMKYVALVYPEAVCHHSPNEGKRSKFERFLMKLMGVKRGFPDLQIFYPPKSLVIVLEIKTEDRNRKTAATQDQLDWINTLNACGIPAKVTFGFEESRQFIDENLAR